MNLLKKLINLAMTSYNTMEVRYGKKGAKIIFGLAVVTFPFPGNVTILIVMAELIKKVKG